MLPQGLSPSHSTLSLTPEEDPFQGRATSWTVLQLEWDLPGCFLLPRDEGWVGAVPSSDYSTVSVDPQSS